MGFGSKYTFEELAHTLRTTAPAQLTLSAGQLLDLIEDRDGFDDADISASYDDGYDEGYAAGFEAGEQEDGAA